MALGGARPRVAEERRIWTSPPRPLAWHWCCARPRVAEKQVAVVEVGTRSSRRRRT